MDENTYLVADFSQPLGLPLLWEQYLDGQRTRRLRFADLATHDKSSHWQSVSLEDAAGRTLVRWQLVEVVAVQSPPLGDGWWAYLHINTRPAAGDDEQQVARALVSLHNHEWKAAAAELQAALKRQPVQLHLLAAQLDLDRINSQPRQRKNGAP